MPKRRDAKQKEFNREPCRMPKKEAKMSEGKADRDHKSVAPPGLEADASEG